jgi:hypothetical protein
MTWMIRLIAKFGLGLAWTLGIVEAYPLPSKRRPPEPFSGPDAELFERWTS